MNGRIVCHIPHLFYDFTPISPSVFEFFSFPGCCLTNVTIDFNSYLNIILLTGKNEAVSSLIPVVFFDFRNIMNLKKIIYTISYLFHQISLTIGIIAYKMVVAISLAAKKCFLASLI
ncbi:Uncharacterised protein [Segatella copri]|nr:Uncharacterised protein [Segatella copri]